MLITRGVRRTPDIDRDQIAFAVELVGQGKPTA
jgi:hypothetical protein